MKIYGVKPIEAPKPALDKRYESLLSQVQELNAADTACLLDYLLGVRKADTAFLDIAEKWLKQSVANHALTLTLEELQWRSMVVEQAKAQSVQEAASTPSHLNRRPQ